MNTLNRPVDITVQKLLCLDAHALDAEIYRAISGLIERCEVPQLERVQASISLQLLENWSASEWSSALQQLLQASGLQSLGNQVVQSDLRLSMLLLQANARLCKCRQNGCAAQTCQIKSIPATAEHSAAYAGAIAAAV